MNEREDKKVEKWGTSKDSPDFETQKEREREREGESERTRENEWENVRERERERISVCKSSERFCMYIHIYILYIVYAHCTVIRATLLSVSVVSGNIRARKLFSCIMNE